MSTLEKAWAKALAAFPAEGYISLSGPFGRTVHGPYDDHYNASAYLHSVVRDGERVVYPIAHGSGSTPGGALMDLTRTLRMTVLRDPVSAAVGSEK